MEGNLKKDRSATVLLVMIFTVIFGCLFGMLYQLYTHPGKGCPCPMVKNRECAP